jgi:hypothetical protein
VTTTWLRAAVREKVADTPESYVDDTDEVDTDDYEEIADTTAIEPASTAELAPPLEETSKKSR